MNNEKLTTFMDTYRVCLREAVRKYPLKYDYGTGDTDKVVDKMRRAILVNPKMVNYRDSEGFKLTCRSLGIKHTVREILAYLEV